jgi:hypothetical protein
MNINQDDKQKEIPITMNGTEVMNYLSLDPQKLCFLAKEGHFVPHSGVHPSWFKLLIGDLDELKRRVPGWLYLKSDVEAFKLNNTKYLEGEWKQKAVAIAESQKPNKPELEYLSTIGKKGGEASKTNQPILLAIVQYLQEHSKIECKSNYQIAESFKRNVRKNEPIIVNFNECEWDVYFADNYIEAIADATNKKKNKDKSIAYSTFRNSYISEAKKIIKKPQAT